MDTKNLKIIGTSHISRRSIREIEKAFETFQPDIVAVELDRRRLDALLQGGPRPPVPFAMAKQIGVTGWLFLRIGGWMQRKLGSIVDVEPGADMMRAVDLARMQGKPLLLADRDVLLTLKRLRLSRREKFRLVWDVVSGPFQREKVKIRLDGVPSPAVIKKLLGMMKERYPNLHRVLVEERNEHIAMKVQNAAKAHPEAKILLVVGAGHEEELRERLSFSEAG